MDLIDINEQIIQVEIKGCTIKINKFPDQKALATISSIHIKPIICESLTNTSEVGMIEEALTTFQKYFDTVASVRGLGK